MFLDLVIFMYVDYDVRISAWLIGSAFKESGGHGVHFGKRIGYFA